MKSCNTSTKLERKTVEKNRRTQMKSLCFKLASLVPSYRHPKEALSQQDQVDLAMDYIKKLQAKIDDLKQKRDLMKLSNATNKDTGGGPMMGFRLPVVELRNYESTLEVVLTSGLNKNFMMCDVIRVLEEEGADVKSASLSVMADKVIHTIHFQVKSPRVGFECERALERLKELVH